METIFDIEEPETDFEITEERISCGHGKLEYYYDGDEAIVNSISVYLKRMGIGTKLVSCNNSLKMSVKRLNRNVSKKKLKFRFSKNGELVNGRNTDNESKRSRPIKDNKPDRIKSNER